MSCWHAHNRREHAAVRRALVGTVGPVIIELGAYDGSDTVALYDDLRPSRMVAVEPDVRVLDELRRKVDDRDVIILPLAIGAWTGEVPFYTSHPPGSSSILKPKLHLTLFPGVRFTSGQMVMVTTLDALFHRLRVPVVDLLWCDVQGAEREVIVGGQETLRCTRFALLECDAVELYEGQVTRDGLLDLLPGWEVIEEWPDQGNVFLRNVRYETHCFDARPE